MALAQYEAPPIAAAAAFCDKQPFPAFLKAPHRPF
jgi:hypothetical protein